MAKQIKVADSTHEKLHIIKKANRTGSLDGAIIHMMQGCVDEMNIIKREQVALTLTYQGFEDMDRETKTYTISTENTLDLTYKTLRNAEVGNVYAPRIGSEVYYSYDIATVVYADDEFVALKIKTLTHLEWCWDMEDMRFIGVHLF